MNLWVSTHAFHTHASVAFHPPRLLIADRPPLARNHPLLAQQDHMYSKMLAGEKRNVHHMAQATH